VEGGGGEPFEVKEVGCGGGVVGGVEVMSRNVLEMCMSGGTGC